MNQTPDGICQTAGAELSEVGGCWGGALPRKSAWAICDNALFALTNFLAALAVARHASVEEYGTFALAQSIALFIGMLHTAFITEPVLVFGSERYRERTEEYVSVAVVLHAGIFLLILAILAAAILAFRRMGFSMWARAFSMAAIGSPFILLSWFLRKACYIKKKPEIACMAGVIYVAALSPCLYVLTRTVRLDGLTAFAAMGVAGIPASLWILGRIGARCRLPEPKAFLGEVLHQHFRYGRWALGAGATRWVPFNVPLLALASSESACYSAALRALMTILMPAVQFFQAVNCMLIPFCASRSRTKVAPLVTSVAAAELLVAIAYSLATWFASRALLHALYTGKYDVYAPYLPPLSLLLMGDAVAGVLSSALQALELPGKVFGAYFAGALFTAFGIIAFYPLPLKGAVWLIVTVYGLTAALLATVLYRVLSDSRIACFTAKEESCP